MPVNAYKLLNIAAREDSGQRELAIYRGMCIAGAIIYPLFYFLYTGTDTGYPTSIALPLINSSLCLMFLAGSYYSTAIRHHADHIAQVLFYTFTLHALYNLDATSFNAAFFVDFLVVITIFSVATSDKILLTAYSLFTFLAFGAVNFSANTFSDAVMYQSNVGVIFLIFHIVLSHKIELKTSLAAKAELMFKLFSKSPDAILFYDPRRNEIVNCNDMALQLFGFSTRDEMKTMPIRRFFAGGEVPSTVAHMFRHIRKGNAAREEQLLTRTGHPFWGQIALSDFAVGNRSFVVVRVSDIDQVKKASEALRKSEERYRDIIESSNNLICVHGIDGTIHTANPAFRHILGYDPDWLVGQKIASFIPERHRADFERYTENLLANGTDRGLLCLYDSNRNIKYFEYNNTLRSDADGRMTVHAMATDATDKHLLQQQIVRSEKRHRLIAENSHDLVCQHFPDGRFDYVSHSVTNMLGFTSGDLMNVDPMELVHPDDRRLFKLLSPFYTEQIDNEPTMVEYRLVHKSGRVVWVNTIFKPVHDRRGVLEYYHSASRDVTERKRVEALQERKDRLFKSLTEASSTLLSQDFDTAIHQAFKCIGTALEADRISCYERFVAGGVNLARHMFEWQNDGNVFTKDDPAAQNIPIDANMPHWYQSLENGLVIKGLTEDFPYPERLIPESRGVKSVMLLPLRLHGELKALVAVEYMKKRHVWTAVEESVLKTAADVIARTMERINAEAALKKAKEEAEAASAAKEAFIANVSHEVRTPMNGIIGLTQLMNKTKLDDTQRKYIAAMRQSGEFMVNIINDLLDFSKVVAGHMEFENIPFDITGMLFNINQTYGTRAVEKGIALRIDTDDALPRLLKGDPTRLNQILVNLLGNAIKFTDKGFVGLGVKIVTETEESIRLKFSVSDTGIGIPKEKQDTVFECFRQAGSDTTRKYGGTGLGLSIVKKLVEAQNSEIVLQSEQGKGSVFMFELSFEKVTDAMAASAETNHVFNDLTGVRILLAEDNTVNQLLANDLITGWGATLCIVQNGKEAVDKLQNESFDLVLMDVQMPVLGGLEATQLIRNSDASFKNIPVIAMTADAVKQNIRRCFDAGMTDHITKPFDATQLNNLIWRHVPEERRNNLSPVSVHSSETPAVVQPSATAYRYISLQNLLEFSRGKNDFVVKMLKLLIEQTPPAVKSIGENIEAANWEEVRALSHKMKPNVHLMGNPELDKLILTLEKDADSRQSVETLPEVYADFRQLYDCAMSELETAYQSFLVAAR